MISTLYHYQLPIQTNLILRGHQLHYRQGLIIELKYNGIVGYGEIAPLPFFSDETLEQSERQIKELLNQSCNLDDILLDNLYPSVAFGLSCALAELKGELQSAKKLSSVPLFKGDLAIFKTELEKMPIKIGKFKVGIESLEKEVEKIKYLFNNIPNLKLRLDANRQWNWQQAVEFGKRFTKNDRLKFDFIEEPCATPEQSSIFAQQFLIPIAFDESLRESNFFAKNIQNMTAYIIKPTLTGSLEKCQKLIEQAHKQGLQVVISSSIESSLALSQLVCFAQKHTPNTLAGLDTLNLMQHQLVRHFENSKLPLLSLKSDYVKQIGKWEIKG
ncbi:o-succinylbenzoate synthase [Phocoenobacter uteri]|uniref:o-succinylbenzoate synthase n=1 Tax=Phocoenobacter uteri TaxID=146806 RepID=A0A379C7U4_9PAST|nr:o-succinylbenzoate synthase [Phocoenobacter uteri]MDG6882295.1 hypothetical protein [Phocoenobacter uteri]SUB58452.1 o-succinylbenzoate synthase [Phocoenobacter uteri]